MIKGMMIVAYMSLNDEAILFQEIDCMFNIAPETQAQLQYAIAQCHAIEAWTLDDFMDFEDEKGDV